MKTLNTQDSIQTRKANQYESIGELGEVFILIGKILAVVVKSIYYTLESVYYKIRPKPTTCVKGEIVLITGSGHGIGKELALKYASEGATVICWDINEKNNNDTVKEISEMGYAKAYAYQCDITNRDEVLRVAEDVRRQVGDVTILINNAGIMPCHSLLDHSHEEIRKIIDVNLFAHFWTLEAFLPAMKKNNHGHIISLSSMAGMVGLTNLVPYCASKFGVRGYMEALFEELRTNPDNKIKITGIFPYMVNTGLCKRPKIQFEKLMPMLEPKYVANEIYFAQIKGEVEVTLPKYLKSLTYFSRCLPIKAALDIKDNFDASVESDL